MLPIKPRYCSDVLSCRQPVVSGHHLIRRYQTQHHGIAHSVYLEFLLVTREVWSYPEVHYYQDY